MGKELSTTQRIMGSGMYRCECELIQGNIALQVWRGIEDNGAVYRRVFDGEGKSALDVYIKRFTGDRAMKNAAAMFRMQRDHISWLARKLEANTHVPEITCEDA